MQILLLGLLAEHPLDHMGAVLCRVYSQAEVNCVTSVRGNFTREQTRSRGEIPARLVRGNMYPYAEGTDRRRVLSLIRTWFSKSHIYTKSDRHIVFVCGGDKSKQNLRNCFLKYSKIHLPHIRVLLAEDAYLDLISGSKNKFVNLATFEDLLADIADCVVLFPESPGSFAELGFFAAKNRIAAKVLPVSDHEYQADDSFINLGPIAIFNQGSSYRPTLQINY